MGWSGYTEVYDYLSIYVHCVKCLCVCVYVCDMNCIINDGDPFVLESLSNRFGLGYISPISEKAQLAECVVCYGLSNDTLNVILPKL